MKRIFSILAVICLIVSLAVPTLAAETTVELPKGTWHWNSTPDISWFMADHTNPTDIKFTFRSNGEYFTYMRIGINGGKYVIAYNSVQKYNEATGWSNGFDTFEVYQTGQYVSVDFYNWLIQNATPPTCDGSACSVADYDVNGICDTCGMTLAYSVQRNYTPNTYPSSLPVLPLGFNDSDDFVVVEVNGVTYLHALVNYGDLDHWDTKASSTSYRATAYGVNGEPVITKYYKYQLVDGDWNQVQSSLTQTTTTFGKFDEVTFIYSTIDIKDSDGNLFFPVPLWMEMDRVTQGEMVQTAETVGGTMTTLVLCGVGCLALLVVLKLFGKRSLIYRN